MKRARLRIFKNLLLLITALLIGAFIFLGIAFIYFAGQIPDPSTIAVRQISESTKIYDRTEQTILYDIHGEEKRTIIPWDQIPDSIKRATLASEDSDFYNHPGLDFRGLFRALYKDLTSFSLSQGGSTITQQLVKISLLGQQKTFSRKIKEAILSIEIERRFSKDQIFWMYLNQIPYGSNTYGIEAASQTFFGKPAKDLDIAEAAFLAALPKAPSYYSPYGNHFSELLSRRDSILNRMKDLGYISADELTGAKKETPQLRKVQDAILAPHFVIMVREYLVKKYGEDMVQNSGLKVITTLDTNLQQMSDDLVKKYGEINAEKYKASNLAFVSLDPKTGQILSMVGSHDYFDIKNEGNFNVALSPRQPGSSFKPIAYAEALSKGFTDSTIIFDVKTEFNPLCDSLGEQGVDSTGQKCYHPGNYDGRFRGPVTLRQALSQSLNVPSVKVLYLANLDDTIDLAHRLGITTLNDRTSYGLSLVLGGGEVKLTDLVSAYGVFANDGVKNDQSFILKVVTGDGRVLEEYKSNPVRVLDSQITRTLTDMLSDNKARGPIFGYNSPLYFSGRQVAAKTGTTQENRDAWVLGYTPSLVAGVWVGNNDNSPMTRQGAGISAAGPLWHEFMQSALKNSQPEEFVKPDPVSANKIMLDGEFLDKDGGAHSILYYIDRKDPLGDAPTDPSQDPQFKNWEKAVNRWFSAGGVAQ